MTTRTLRRRFCFGRFLKTLLIAAVSTGLALPSPALGLRPSIEGTGLEELRQALHASPTTPSRSPAAVRSAAGMEEQVQWIVNAIATLGLTTAEQRKIESALGKGVEQEAVHHIGKIVLPFFDDDGSPLRSTITLESPVPIHVAVVRQGSQSLAIAYLSGADFQKLSAALDRAALAAGDARSTAETNVLREANSNLVASLDGELLPDEPIALLAKRLLPAAANPVAQPEPVRTVVRGGVLTPASTTPSPRAASSPPAASQPTTPQPSSTISQPGATPAGASKIPPALVVFFGQHRQPPGLPRSVFYGEGDAEYFQVPREQVVAAFGKTVVLNESADRLMFAPTIRDSIREYVRIFYAGHLVNPIWVYPASYGGEKKALDSTALFARIVMDGVPLEFIPDPSGLLAREKRATAGMEEPERSPRSQRAISPVMPRVNFLVVTDDEAMKKQLWVTVAAWDAARAPGPHYPRSHGYELASPSALPEPHISRVPDVVVIGATPGMDVVRLAQRLQKDYPKAQRAIVGFADPARQAALSEPANRLLGEGVIQASLIMPVSPAERFDYVDDNGTQASIMLEDMPPDILGDFIAGLADAAIKEAAAGLEEPTTMPVAWEANRFPVAVRQRVVLQPAEGRVAEKVGYIFRPEEAGLGVLFAGFQSPETDPAVYYVLVDHVEQAQALIQAGVAPVRIVALANNDTERRQFLGLAIPGDNILVGSDVPRALALVGRWVKTIHGAAVRTLEDQSWPTDAQLLLAQISQWLDEERWLPAQPLTAGVAETITRINQMA